MRGEGNLFTVSIIAVGVKNWLLPNSLTLTETIKTVLLQISVAVPLWDVNYSIHSFTISIFVPVSVFCPKTGAYLL